MLPRSLISVLLAAWVLMCAGCAPSKPAAPTYPLKAECPMCGGSGRMVDGETNKPIACSECNGSGQRPAYKWEKRITCGKCNSAGIVNGIECGECQGLGWIGKYDLSQPGAQMTGRAWRIHVDKQGDWVKVLWRDGTKEILWDGWMGHSKEPSECPDYEDPRWTLQPGQDEGKQGRIFDGSHIQRIKDNRARRVEVRRKIVDGWVSIWSGLSGLFGIPQRIIEGIVMVAVGICSLCCLALGVLLFSVVAWAGVSVWKARAK